MTKELLQKMDNWKKSGFEKREIVETNLKFVNDGKVFLLYISCLFNSELVTAHKFFPMDLSDSVKYPNNDIYRFNLIVDQIEKEFFQKKEEIMAAQIKKINKQEDILEYINSIERTL